jgi:shikimate kinase
MSGKIITISREFGSGGRTIGREVAQRLGIPFYDKELVEQVALASGFAP